MRPWSVEDSNRGRKIQKNVAPLDAAAFWTFCEPELPLSELEVFLSESEVFLSLIVEMSMGS